MEKVCGIYCIRNIVDGKMYIGQSTNIQHRKNCHFHQLRNEKHFNVHLQRAYNKYGEKAFIFEILEVCEGMSFDEITEREQFYVDKNKGYNLLYNIKKECVNANFLSKDDVLKIRKKLKNGCCNINIAKEMKISKRCVRKVKNGEYNGIYCLKKESYAPTNNSGLSSHTTKTKKEIIDIINVINDKPYHSMEEISLICGVCIKTIKNVIEKHYHSFYDLPDVFYNKIRDRDNRKTLEKDIVLKIIKNLALGLKISDIAGDIGVSSSTVSRIKNGFYNDLYNIKDFEIISYDTKGKNNGNILSKNKVIEVREKLKDQMRLSEISDVCKVSFRSVSKIKDGEYDDIYGLEHIDYIPYNRGGINSYNVLSKEKVVEIKNELKKSISINKISEKTGVSKPTIRKVKNCIYDEIYNLK